jgi:hypothetical protein
MALFQEQTTTVYRAADGQTYDSKYGAELATVSEFLRPLLQSGVTYDAFLVAITQNKEVAHWLADALVKMSGSGDPAIEPELTVSELEVFLRRNQLSENGKLKLYAEGLLAMLKPYLHGQTLPEIAAEKDISELLLSYYSKLEWSEGQEDVVRAMATVLYQNGYKLVKAL